MKFSIEKEIFSQGLSWAQGIVERRNTMPILENVLINAEGSHISLTTTDLEIGMRVKASAKVTTEGAVTVKARKLYDIVKEFPGDVLDVSLTDGLTLEVTGGHSVYRLLGIGREEFPNLPEEGSEFQTVKSDLLAEMIGKVIFAASTDDTRYNISGVYWEKANGAGLKMVATDGHRLCVIERDMEAERALNLNEGIILPRKGMMELKKVLESQSSVETVEIGVSGSNLVCRAGDAVLLMRLIDGEYPDYRKVIPEESGRNHGYVKRDEMAGALRRVSLISDERSRGVKLLFSEGQLTIESNNPDLGEAREEIGAEYSGGDVVIGFNARYVQDLLGALAGETVDISLKDELSPGLFTSADDAGYTCVVMPMRL